MKREAKMVVGGHKNAQIPSYFDLNLSWPRGDGQNKQPARKQSWEKSKTNAKVF